MYFYIKMSSVIIVGKILTAQITMAIWIGKQTFSVQKVTSIKLLVTLPKTSSEFHRMTQISHKTKKSPAFVIASFQSRVFFLKNLETICKKGSDAATVVQSDPKWNCTAALVIYSASLMQTNDRFSTYSVGTNSKIPNFEHSNFGMSELRTPRTYGRKFKSNSNFKGRTSNFYKDK